MNTTTTTTGNAALDSLVARTADWDAYLASTPQDDFARVAAAIRALDTEPADGDGDDVEDLAVTAGHTRTVAAAK